jgi:hypothetical protein
MNILLAVSSGAPIDPSHVKETDWLSSTSMLKASDCNVNPFNVILVCIAPVPVFSL